MVALRCVAMVMASFGDMLEECRHKIFLIHLCWFLWPLDHLISMPFCTVYSPSDVADVCPPKGSCSTLEL